MAKDLKYSTIQVSKSVKIEITEYCNAQDLKIGKFIERCFRYFISGSVLGKE